MGSCDFDLDTIDVRAGSKLGGWSMQRWSETQAETVERHRLVLPTVPTCSGPVDRETARPFIRNDKVTEQNVTIRKPGMDGSHPVHPGRARTSRASRGGRPNALPTGLAAWFRNSPRERVEGTAYVAHPQTLCST